MKVSRTTNVHEIARLVQQEFLSRLQDFDAANLEIYAQTIDINFEKGSGW